VIERLLARLFREAKPPWLLKGGFAMDLRFRPRARTTKDIDLSVVFVGKIGGPMLAELREQLQAAVDVSLDDFLSYRIGEPKKNSRMRRGEARGIRVKQCWSERRTPNSTSTWELAMPRSAHRND
jgi:hypothetical protein